jgi:hypothetical protein
MLRDIQIALTSRVIVLILATSTLLRMYFHFIFLSESPSPYGPDEGTYSALAKYVSDGLPVREFPIYGPNLYNSSKSIILPSALLIKLGIDELDAIRLTSSVFGLTSIMILAITFVALKRNNIISSSISSNFFDKKTILLVALFAFMPSNFIWSTIGLRESGSQLWLLMSFYFILKSSFSFGWKVLVYSFFTLVSLTLAHGTRPETALIFTLVAALFSFFVSIKLRKLVLHIAILLGLLLGQVFTTSPQREVVINKITEEKVEKNAKVDAFEALKKRLSTAQHLEQKRNLNSLESESALSVSSCVNSSRDVMVLIKCNLAELPYRLFAFLFRPLIFYDQGSSTLTFAAIENIGWTFLILIGIFSCFKKDSFSLNFFIRLGLVSYIMLFSSAAALYEGNLGTAFRHKSSILWPSIIILILTDSSNSILRRARVLSQIRGKMKS